MKTRRNLNAFACALVAIVAQTIPAQAGLLYESATLGPTDQDTGWGIFGNQWLGARFQLTLPTNITAIGGHIGGVDGADIFGAIVKLDSASALPAGTPFSGNELLTSGVFSVSGPTEDRIFPLSATLEPGNYAVVFGQGILGDSSIFPQAYMAYDNVDLLGASYFVGAPSFWSDGGFSNARFTVFGDVGPVPEPSTAMFGALGIALAMSQRTRAKRNTANG